MALEETASDSPSKRVQEAIILFIDPDAPFTGVHFGEFFFYFIFFSEMGTYEIVKWEKSNIKHF